MARTKDNLGQHLLRLRVVTSRLWRLARTHPDSHSYGGTTYSNCDGSTPYPYAGAAGTDTNLAAHRGQ